MTKLQGLKAPVSKWIADYITTGCKRYDTVVERKMKIFYFDLVVYRYLKNYWCMGVPERCTGDVERESKKKYVRVSICGGYSTKSTGNTKKRRLSIPRGDQLKLE